MSKRSRYRFIAPGLYGSSTGPAPPGAARFTFWIAVFRVSATTVPPSGGAVQVIGPGSGDRNSIAVAVPVTGTANSPIGVPSGQAVFNVAPPFTRCTLVISRDDPSSVVTHGPPKGQPVPAVMSTPSPSRSASRVVCASIAIHCGDRKSMNRPSAPFAP
ncbi:MAG: hypothetical protein U1F87_00500 [Kiritimatiellia bacterium]